MPAGKKAAGGKDIFSAGGADGACDAGGGQTVAEDLHQRFRSSAVWKVRYLMEPDKVNPAGQAAQKADKSIGMGFIVIKAREHRVLKTKAALTCKIILTQKIYYLLCRIGLLYRHHSQTLFWQWIVKAYRKVAAASVKEFLQFG